MLPLKLIDAHQHVARGSRHWEIIRSIFLHHEKYMIAHGIVADFYQSRLKMECSGLCAQEK